MSDHHLYVLVVTAKHEEAVIAHAKALELFSRPIYEHHPGTPLRALVSEINTSATNGYSSFFVAPDGSGVTFANHEAASLARNDFAAWAKSAEAPMLDWAIVRLGGEQETYVVDAHDRYEDEESW